MSQDDNSPRVNLTFVGDVQEDDTVLDFAQRKRLEILECLDVNDPKGAVSAAMLLNDLTSTAMGRKRINAQVKSDGDRNEVVRGLVTGFMKDVGGAVNPFMKAVSQDTPDEIEHLANNAPNVPTNFVDGFVAVPGETSIGIEPFVYSDFMKKTDYLDDEDAAQ